MIASLKGPRRLLWPCCLATVLYLTQRLESIMASCEHGARKVGDDALRVGREGDDPRIYQHKRVLGEVARRRNLT